MLYTTEMFAVCVVLERAGFGNCGQQEGERCVGVIGLISIHF
jgi:hypothetical protein